MTETQMRLPGIEPPRQLRPSVERSAPAFWVRRLRVLNELAPGNEHIVRDIELRRGLNIVWAPPHSAGEDNALFRDGVAGHTAGKSTFCRLLRHVLGERGFAPDSIRRRIRESLPTAWVVAEVVINDVIWVVARPLSIGPRPFCLRGDMLDDVFEGKERLDYQEFLEALAETTIERLTSARFPANDEPVRWEHVLPWLARDQECRFADFLEWRHSASGSEAPALTVDERQFIVRAALGLISDSERAEQQKNARLVAEKKEAARLEPLLRHQAETDRARLSKVLGKDLPLASTPLFGSETRAEIARRWHELEAREKALVEGDRRAELLAALQDANRQVGALKKSLEEVQSRLTLVQVSVAELVGQDQSSLLAALPPSRDFCNVPLRVAREKGCPCAADRPIDLGARRSERTAAEDLAVERKLAKTLEQEVNRTGNAINAAEAAAATALRLYTATATAYENEKVRLQKERSNLDQLDQLVEAAEGAVRDATTKAESITQLARDIDESYALQEKIREGQRVATSRFSTRFDYVLRAIIGDNVTGRVDTSGRSLALAVDEHGERDSAAIATIKLLAFDLAAVVTSVEGDGAFPRFLIHDGPREADMAPDVYERLFLFAHELEKCFTGEPSFQYILTTTTDPPDAFTQRNTPWLRLRLAGAPAEERLLRCNL
ncbi:MAG TPA: hypothetical protein VJ673_11510 [Aromatoleum sp.]|uniref:hypothetical protein n=1 Tax=Aromatoleum sp. TaxID=2307007 RepID=UPI002B4A7B4F|nr:hypothetical protein [Aromatoleum sp.]HJV26309.1 hypothetical protein [Aromatoleum sp.]